MIRIESMEIEEFRGIRKLELDLKRRSFGISGPNGTGKSGVVDAIEFALTGNISRLTGEGTSDMSVKAHGPHVDMRTDPKRAKVRLRAFVAPLNKTVTIERSVAAPNAPLVTPTDAKVRAIMDKLAQHPEFTLSRREIIKYILTPPGQRAQDVQALLRLDDLEKLRKSLQKIANECKAVTKKAKDADTSAKNDFLKALQIATLSKEALLAAVNTRRAILQLEPVTDLAGDASVKAGVTQTAEKEETPPKLRKAQALGDIAAYAELVAKGEPADVQKGREDGAALLSKLANDPELMRAARHQALLKQGLELVDEGLCPLCDTPWNMEELRTHIEQKMSKAQDAQKLLQDLENALTPLHSTLKGLADAVGKLTTACALAEPKIDVHAFDTLTRGWKQASDTLAKLVSDPAGWAAAAAAVLEQNPFGDTGTAAATLETLRTVVAALPDPSNEQAAREYLIVAQEHYDLCKRAKRDLAAAEESGEIANAVLELYNASATSVLEGIYTAVEADFTAYYRIINHEDEASFEGKLTPSYGKLAFDVDFYGRGKFPPGAYHSEGHQDGMGLCLYLALMKHTLGQDFTFAVLDDVMMSVDAGHRRDVCKLLRQEFPKTQFVLTTHDPVWLNFMRNEKLIDNAVSFCGWSVDTGPKVWVHADVWEEINAQLASGKVADAAGTLRRYLEATAFILADNLRAPVEFRSDGQYDLGDLLGPVTAAWTKALDKAEKAATSWGHADRADELKAMFKDAKDNISATHVEQWMINKAVHFNAWYTLLPNEFSAVSGAFKKLLDSMRCTHSACGGQLYISPRKGKPEALRCACGHTNFSLTKK